MPNWDQDMEFDRVGDWMKQWLMIQNFTTLNTMSRKTSGKQATYRTPEGTEKKLDYIVNRKHIYCSRDAEANDMIHMGSDTQKCYGTIKKQTATRWR